MSAGEPAIAQEIRPCRMCATDFAATATRHEPRPVVWLRQRARILIVGQAPGLRVHESGIPFDDRSGDRFAWWLGLRAMNSMIATGSIILPMAFCFPGYHVNGSDLPPPPRCAATWRSRALDALNQVKAHYLDRGYAHGWHLGADARKAGVTATVADWRHWAPVIKCRCRTPSWRNNAFLRRNPRFGTELFRHSVCVSARSWIRQTDKGAPNGQRQSGTAKSSQKATLPLLSKAITTFRSKVCGQCTQNTRNGLPWRELHRTTH